jgi:hypothetical protein
MHSYRPFVFAFDDRFCGVSQKFFPINLQTRALFRRPLLLLVAALLTTFLPGLLPDAAQAQTLTPTPASVSFGTVAVGTKNTQTIQVRNGGSASVTINSAAVGGNGLSVSGLTMPLTLASGATHSFTLAFLPIVAGSVSGSVTLKNSSGTALAKVTVSGTGGTPTRTLQISASSLNFGNETVGQSSTLGVTLVNTGNSSLTVSQVAVSGTGFSALSGVSGATLAAGQSAVLEIDFAPKAAGSVTGTVTVTSNASNSPGSLKVSGTGVAATTSTGSTVHSVALSWVASTSANIVGYYVYRSGTSGGSYSRINSSPTNATKYTDGSVTAGDTYYYVVTSVNSSGQESADSNQIKAVIP